MLNHLVKKGWVNIFATVLVSFIGMVSLSGQSQDYLANITHLDVEDGMLHREVNAITEDCKGFMWLGTHRGLNRFDGHSFQAWTKEQDGLMVNSIGNILEDARCNLWLIPFLYEGGDFNILNHHTGELLKFSEKYGTDFPFPLKDIDIQVSATSKGEIILSTGRHGALVKVDTTGKMHIFELPFESLNLRAVANNDQLWAVANDTLLVKLDLDGNILFREAHSQEINAKYFFVDVDGNPYFTGLANTTYGLNATGQIRSIPHGKFPLQKSRDLIINEIIPFDYNQKTNWINSSGYGVKHPDISGDLLLIGPDNNLLYDVEEDFPEIIENGFRSFFVDSDQRIWIGGNFGIYALDVHPNNFRTFITEDRDENPLVNLSTRKILKEGNALYVSLESEGVFKVDIETGDFKEFSNLDQYTNYYFGLAKGPAGRIWLGSLNTVYAIDPITGNYDVLTFRHPTGTTMAWTLFFDEDQRLWVGTQKGLWVLEKGDSELRQFDQLNEFQTLDESHVIFIQPIENGNLFACSDKGIYEIEPGKGVIDRFWTGGDEQHRLPHDNIQHFYQDEAGVFWLSSAGSGLIRWEKENGRTAIFDKSSGLSNDVIYACYPDQHNHLWLASDYGIIRFDKESFTSVAFTSSDGTSHHEFNRTSHLQDDSGDIFFGSLRGITKVDPDKFLTGDFDANLPLIITDFQRFEGRTDRLEDRTMEVIENNRIVLRPTDKFFRIEFALLNYMDMERVNYAYKLEGVDEDWTYQKENYVRFSGIPYGRHILKIKGQMPNGQWSATELSIPVWIPKPFYLKSWFLALAIAFVLILGPLIYYWQTRQLKERQKKLEEIVKERTLQIQQDKQTIENQAEELRQLDQVKSRFFANVSHELRTPLTLMLGPIGSVLKSDKMDTKSRRFLKTAQKNGKNLLNLVNEILDLSKLESGSLTVNEEPVKACELVKRLFSQYDSFAQQKGIRVSLKCLVDPDYTLMMDVNKFEKIFNNLLSNALKFTKEEDSIEVIFGEQKDRVYLRVSDTGEGIHPDDLPHIFDRFYQSKQPTAPTQGGTGIGLALSRELAYSLQGEIKVESELGEGTIFTLELPRKVVQMDMDLRALPVVDMEEIIAEPAPAEIIPTPSEGKKPTLLVVEDNEDLRNYIQQVLSTHYIVKTAENGAEAFSMLTNNPDSDNGQTVDLIISDVMMPVMDGFELLEKLKSSDRLSGLPVVMLTARAALQDKLKALRIGVDDYMLKPFDEEELLARVSNLITNYRERTKTALETTEEEKFAGVTGEDRTWLEELETFTQQNAGNFNLTADMMADEMALSRTQLFRKIKQLTGLTPTQYVQEVRFSQARSLLEDKAYSTVKAVAYEVGFKHVKNFSQQFKKRYGKSPSDYLK